MFNGQIRNWFDAFMIGSIHSWEQFMQLFVFVHRSYDNDQLYDEIESIQREEDKSITNFDLRIILHSYRSHHDDWPSEKEYALFRISLVGKYFFESELKLFFRDTNSNDDDFKYSNE